jgi:hypothetical protein
MRTDSATASASDGLFTLNNAPGDGGALLAVIAGEPLPLPLVLPLELEGSVGPDGDVTEKAIILPFFFLAGGDCRLSPESQKKGTGEGETKIREYNLGDRDMSEGARNKKKEIRLKLRDNELVSSNVLRAPASQSRT